MVENEVSVRLGGNAFFLLFLKESGCFISALDSEVHADLILSPPCFSALMAFLFFVLTALNSAQPMTQA